MAAIAFPSSTYLREYSKSAQPSPVQKLNPLVDYNPVQENRTNDRWNKLYLVAAVVTAVAFIVFATAVTVLFAEASPLAMVVVLAIGLPSSWQYLISPLLQKAWHYQDCAAFDRSIIKQMDTLKDEELGETIQKLGVKPGIEPKKLHSLFARYLYCIDLANKLSPKEMGGKFNIEGMISPPKNGEKDKSYKEEIDPKEYTIGKTNFADARQRKIFDIVQGRYAAQRRNEVNAAILKLEAASFLKIMQNPYEADLLVNSPQPSRYFQLVNLPLEKRLIAQEQNQDPDSHLLVKTPSKNYTAADISKATVPQLAQEIFGLKC